jgi:hypothetical protein
MADAKIVRNYEFENINNEVGKVPKVFAKLSAIPRTVKGSAGSGNLRLTEIVLKNIDIETFEELSRFDADLRYEVW